MTSEEKRLVARAGTDLETGNYLLCKRTEEELNMLSELCEAKDTPENNRTERQKEIIEEYKLCTDYNYWSKKVNIALNTPEESRTERQKELIEEYKHNN